MLTTENFIEKAKAIHGEKYDYSLVEYKGVKVKIKIICQKHGIFEQFPNKHCLYFGCTKCSNKFRATDANYFIERANKIHNNKYDYSNVIYVNMNTDVEIICPIHGNFIQKPTKHISKKGCFKCGRISIADKLRSNTSTFILKANKIHNNKYEYLDTVYSGNENKVKIKCFKHGHFLQSPSNHLSGNGCPICRESKGENTIRNFLIENNVTFIKQKKFNDCKNLLPLPFDFYLPDYKICIEYQGQQHYLDSKTFGSKRSNLKEIQLRDNIKYEYCLKNNINLLIISYKDNIINKLNIIFSTYVFK